MYIPYAILADFTENSERIRNEKSSEYPFKQGGGDVKTFIRWEHWLQGQNTLDGI